ncbi:MAG: PQQ-binding-like beta-propeller repeat protein [Gammaproteobacteria bacterium]|nr:PQQ-binding-like beta-propeller repeat protein [Gammaproteobacteria bacterium]
MKRVFLALAVLALAATAGAGEPAPEAAPAVAPEVLYERHCATCHANPATRSPTLASLQQMPLARLLSAMEFGKMQVQAAALTPQQRLALGQWLAAPEDARRDAWIARHACTHPPGEIPLSGAQNWGFGAHNTRFLREGVAITATNIGQLELAWSLALPQVTDMRSQPVAAGSLLFLGTQTGNLLALDQASGCVHWASRAVGGIRSALTLAATPDGVATLFFADDLGTVYAVDARTGIARWHVDVRLFPSSVVSGSPSYHDGRLFVPLSSFEVAAAGMPTHACCRSHGGVRALDAQSGEVLWTWHSAPAAEPTGKSAAGVQRWGPSGASVWSTPTIDAKRGLLYVGTGQNFSRPATATSDAVIALGIDDGKPRWQFQALADDVWNGACQLAGPNCPEHPGPDWDIGASVVLSTAPAGRDTLLAGQKSGELFALDPDARGKLLWRKRLSQGTPNGGNSGIHWGMASDGVHVFAPVSDPERELPGYTPRPGVYALRIADGSLLWEHPVTRGCVVDPADVPLAGLAAMRQGATGAARSPWPACSFFYAHSAAAVLANDVVYAGALDGRLRALDAATGRELRTLETARAFRAGNGIDGHGGSIDVGGVLPHGRFLFVVSGYGMFRQMPGNMLLAWALPETPAREEAP